MNHPKKAVREARSAWQEAQEQGVDMSLIEANLRRTPQERIRAHSRALATAEELRKGLTKHHD